MKLLITAFEPFGGEAVNPALLAVERLPDRIETVELVKLTVPVEFGRSVAAVCAAIDRHRPDAVLCVGQAGGRAAITPERVAINGDIDSFTQMLWENLNENNKISLFVRYTDIETGKFEQRIINKHL